MTDRKNKKAALCITMSLVLALCGCAAAAPAAGQGSIGKEEAGQESTMQANAGQEASGENAGQKAAGQETPGQETVGEEMSAQTTVEEDEFDFEEGDPNTPAADGEMPSKFDLRDVQVKGSGIVPPIRFQNPFGDQVPESIRNLLGSWSHCRSGDQYSRQRAGAGRRLYGRDLQSV